MVGILEKQRLNWIKIPIWGRAIAVIVVVAAVIGGFILIKRRK